MQGKVPIIEVRGVTKRFGGVTALDRVHFSMEEGTVMALVGDNGAGKSTLIKVISGVFSPDAGKMYFAGRPVHFTRPQDAWEMGIATIYQELALCARLDVVENIFLGRELTRRIAGIPFLDVRRMREISQRRLSELDADIPSVKADVQFLSGGQRQAVAIARALNLDARLVIMDEPTAALAVAEARKVLDLIRQLRAKGRSVILISHNLADVFTVADSITVLRRGRRVGVRHRAETDPDEIVKLITGVLTDEGGERPAKQAG